MESVLSHVNQCQDLFKESSHFEPTIPLLVLYKFEAQLALGIPDAGNILNDLTALPDIEPKTYEAVAGKNVIISILVHLMFYSNSSCDSHTAQRRWKIVSTKCFEICYGVIHTK